MDSVIIAAIISGAFTILAVIIANLIKYRKKDAKSHGVNIIKNRQMEILETELLGDVNIRSNKNIKIEGGKIDGSP